VKKIKGESLTNPREIAKNSKIHDITPTKNTGKRPEYNPKTMDRLKKAVNWITRTVAGETKVGEGIHGVLDLLPIPNQVIAKAASYFTKGEVYEAADELQKLLTVRNGIAVVAFILFVTGLISLDDMRRLLTAIGEFL
jgi:hypothetical protein